MITQQIQDLVVRHLEQYFQDKQVSQPHLLIGLSGGPDSVFLLHMLLPLAQQGKIKLSAAHLDHGWRNDSEQDVRFCQELCNTLNIPFFTQHAQNITISSKPNGSLEEFGRQLRRLFFKSIQEQINADLIVLGHHEQDQQETFFMRLVRGTSLSGLCGMRTFNGYYFRPLLQFSKTAILDYLEKNKIAYLQDSTNLSDEYLRNRIRRHVLPAMNYCDNRFDQKFSSTLEHLRDEHDFLTELAKRSFKEIFSAQPAHKMMGNLSLFSSMHIVLKKRVIILWLVTEKVPFQPSERHLREIIKFLASPNGGSHQLGLFWTVFKKNRFFWIQQHK